MAWPSIEAPATINGRVVKAQHRSSMETGRVISRPKHSSARKTFQLHWPAMTKADFDLLEASFESDQGSTFSWTDPEFSTVYTVRYSDDAIDYKRSGKFPGLLDVAVNLEED